jgi:aspartate racemase
MDKRLDDTRSVIGVLGGMGSDATVDFFAKIVAATPAVADQQHLRIVVDCDPSIPDRSGHIMGQGPDPLPTMIAVGRRLLAAGATVGAIASITGHAYFDGLAAAVPLPFINAFEELAKLMHRQYGGARRIGALSTSGTIKAGLYEKYLSDWRIHYPDDESQARFVMEALYGQQGIKAGNTGEEPRLLLRQAAQRLIARGADVIIIGCTEIPLTLRPEDVAVPLIDPMQVLADALVAHCLGRVHG